MQEYNDYNFTVNINDVIAMINNAMENDCPVMLYINGLYYDVTKGDSKK